MNDLTGKNAIIDIKYKWSNYHTFYNLYIAYLVENLLLKCHLK